MKNTIITTTTTTTTKRGVFKMPLGKFEFEHGGGNYLPGFTLTETLITSEETPVGI